MPKALLDFMGYQFYFWSEEETKMHIHVSKGSPQKNATKFWIEKDEVRLDHNKSQIPEKDLKKIKHYILSNRADIVTAWFDYFGS